MPRTTWRNGKREVSYSKLECLRGDGGPELQEALRDICASGCIELNDSEERELRNLLDRERRQRKTTRTNGRRVETFDSEGERSRLRLELMNRIR